MKIGILTQPLHTNYGGLLQSYALQSVLKKMGHDVYTVDFSTKTSFLKLLKNFLGRIKRKYFLMQNDIDTVFVVRPRRHEELIIRKNLKKFIEDNIQTTEKITHINNINKLNKYKFDAFIVGSDQVWRPKYSPRISTYFLDFLGDDIMVRRIAYAASFGVDLWEYSPESTKKCRLLVQKFDAVSVREDSAVRLCNEYLEIDATHVIDPTMLLNADDYISLVERYAIPKKEKTVMSYILDRTKFKDDLVCEVSNALNLKISSAMPKKKYSKGVRSCIEECVFPSVAEWLRCFIDAAFVVTDSFHGTIFSIIFNKPFIVVGNQERGLARFSSLLKMFDLENRLIFPGEKLSMGLIDTSIDYFKVNDIKSVQQKLSFSFLEKAFKGIS